MSLMYGKYNICKRRLFETKTYNPKTLFYLSYKTARLNGLDLSTLPLTIRKLQNKIDKHILWCDEDIENVLGAERLTKWNFNIIQPLPVNVFLALQNLTEIPDWLDETMWVQFKWIYNKSTTFEFDDFQEKFIEHKHYEKICHNCFNRFLDHALQEMSTIEKTIINYIKPFDAGDILNILQDSYHWCEYCHITPLFRLIKIEY
ncbi:nonstructural protein NS3 [Diatraea saccharalis densovirus]|uniref:Non-structural protein NS3 n=1 Tax=Diatraea saccharalis densovirus TaxID=72003 RepID=VNS3_DSDNV|nr:nonstructural protein NS3 [Diatraea saccharalis densovirus]O71152.1 RecName: Full=Non-structural protein NS3 [Diatraea saccharalis densovirus]AAC17998.1 nonstructural protein NS3 [Diatraea saccharalis densovirus]